MENSLLEQMRLGRTIGLPRLTFVDDALEEIAIRTWDGNICSKEDFEQMLPYVLAFYDRSEEEIAAINEKWRRQRDHTFTRPPLPRKKKGLIYLLYGQKCQLYKIGLTCQSVESRMASIQRATEEILTLLHTVETDDVFTLEKHWHEHFAHKRIKGEWFALDEEDRQLFCSQA